MGAGVGLAAAFAAGIVSFLSPCVLPLVPGYLSVVTGVSLSELKSGQRRTWSVLAPSLLFVSGFAVVFIALGASASVLGAFLAPYREGLTRSAGVLVFAMGFLMLGVVKIPRLYGEARFDMARARTFGRGASLLMGMAFGFGWTPCVGPILASILTLAGSSADVGRGAALLAAYSSGLGLPFIGVALLFGRVEPVLRWLSAHASTVNRVAGTLLMVVGVLIFTDTFRLLSAWLLRAAPFLAMG
ncbi:MAG: cytochrome c biogenesis protein CcdA [Coriobacteriia bacterium]|nr:cytochrome c biogenesis protein CcdA [Coriobacteriia bacterium]